jgi:hypothetical protein
MLSKFYEKICHNYSEFKSELEALSDRTTMIAVKSNQLNVFPALNEVTAIENFKLSVADNTSEKLSYHPKDNTLTVLEKLGPQFGTRKLDLLDLGSEFFKIRDEWEHESQIIMEYNNDLFVVSPLAYQTLLQRVQLAGEYFSEPTLIRGQLIANVLKDITKALTIITRSYDGTNVIFAVNSSKYVYLPQTKILDVADIIKERMSEYKFVKGYVSNEYADLYLEFPNEGDKIVEAYPELELSNEIVPVLNICKSDIGTSSFKVALCWRIKSSIIKGPQKSFKHMGQLDMAEVIKTALWLFDKATILPEKLCEFLEMEVPKSCNLMEVLNTTSKKNQIRHGYWQKQSQAVSRRNL